MEENTNFLVQVNNIEKQLWTLIHTKGISHPDVSILYSKANLTYEHIFIRSNLKQEELQEAEFSLWKLHYKHIDEFRKCKLDTHTKAFESFLLKAAEFYKNLISKIRPSDESGEQKSGFLRHRFYICLGDLERYKEQYLKPHEDDPNWSTSATYYLQAAESWPNSGNPHNQLAVLATYVGDEFLALYHCVRSLAVKEPFPGASNNLLLLFEKNRSCSLKSLSIEAKFNFLNPSERNVAVKDKGESMAGTDLWPLLVRTISFFFLKSSSNEFGSAFASTMRELDKAFAEDDSNLEAMLESYQFMDKERKGPYRILHLVAVFVFIFHEKEEKAKLMNLALTMVFIFMGRVVERCMKKNPLDTSCPLLPSLLVFLDYLPSLLHKTEEEEESWFDEKSETAMSYFFQKLVQFLNRLKIKGENRSAKPMLALWEDHELRSFTPLASTQVLLDFSSDIALRASKELRVQRIINSAFRITTSREKKGGSQKKCLLFDKQKSCFCTTLKEEEVTTPTAEINPIEEEEVILLKPLLRCQSAPKPFSSENTNLTDESLRRTSSLVASSESFSFTQGFKDKDEKHLGLEQDTVVSGRPPSLSAWVVDKNKETARFGLSKPNGLSPIDETSPVMSFDSLSTEDLASLYTPPTPSAPLLPEDASWFHNEASTSKTESFYDQTTFMKPYTTNQPFVGISSSEWLRRYRESRNLGPDGLKNGLAHGSSKLSLLAKYGTPNEQSMIASENSMVYPQMYVETREEKLTRNGYEFSDDPGPFLRYLREKEWLNENGQRLRGPSPAYMNN